MAGCSHDCANCAEKCSKESLLAPQNKYMFDNDPETYYHSGEAQRTDHFVGVDMGIVREVREIRIIQGRNSVDDVDYFDHCILEYSKDGETWVALTEPMEGVYEIEWCGEPFEARYVGIRKLESKKRNWLAIRSFEINPVAEADFGWDANPFTFVKVEGSIVVDIMSGCHADNGKKNKGNPVVNRYDVFFELIS